MLDAYKEVTPVIYGENGIKYIYHENKRNIYFSMHWHERMELLRVDSGKLELHLNEHLLILEPDQVAVICPCMLHAGFSVGDEPLTYHTIMFDVEKFCNSTSAANKYLLPLCKSEIGFHFFTDHPAILCVVDRLITYLRAPLESNPLCAIGAVYDLLGELYTHNLNTTTSPREADKQIRHILKYIDEHYTGPISAKSISEFFGYNETYFCRRFKTITGITVMQYILVRRMETAQKLLLEDQGDINSIAWKCGYSDISYFSNCFRKTFGCSPSEYRKTKGKSVDKLPEVGYNFFRNLLTRSQNKKKEIAVMANLLKLQNGSDVRGVAIEGIEGEAVNLTPEAVNRIGQAFVTWLSARSGKAADDLKIGVGHDSRVTADKMKHAFISGLSAAGACVYDCGLVSTPSMFMTVVFPEFAFDGSVMITASHLPFNRNGLKFFNCDGGLEKANITEILTIAQEKEEVWPEDAAGIPCNSLEAYTRSLREKIRDGVQAENFSNPLKGLRIVVDAGNGAGGFFVNQVLIPLGADTTGSQFLEPDGMFPNHIPNPENKQAMEAIKKAVLDNHADLGIIFDTDVDRMSAVLPDGSEVNRDAIIAMMAAILAKDYPGSTIVTDSVTSDRLTDFLEQELKLKHHRFKRGYKNVINESKRLNAEGIVSPLAIETSGHGALSENYFLDDGAYMAVKLLIAAALAAKEGKQIGAFIEKLAKGFDEREYRMKLKGEDFAAYGKNVLAQFEARAKEAGYAVAPNSYEGVRISFRSEDVQGWLLLRLSLHDPLMPLNMEGVRPGDCEKMIEIVRELLAGFDELDVI